MTKELKLATLDGAKDRVYEVLAKTEGNDWEGLAQAVNAIHNLMMLRCDVMDAELDSPNVYNIKKAYVETKIEDGSPECPENCVESVKEVNFKPGHLELVFKDPNEAPETAAASVDANADNKVSAEVPAPAAEPAPRITKEEVRKRLLTLDKPKIVEALKAVGYTKLSEVPFENYAELLQKAGV